MLDVDMHFVFDGCVRFVHTKRNLKCLIDYTKGLTYI